jgi:hypothetical protein
MSGNLPFAVSIYFDLPILLIVISLVYSATRYERLPMILHEAGRWGVRMALFLGAIGLVLFLLSTYL